MPGLRLGVMGGVRGTGAYYPPMAPASIPSPAAASGNGASASAGGSSALHFGSPFGMHLLIGAAGVGLLLFLYWSAPA